MKSKDKYIPSTGWLIFWLILTGPFCIFYLLHALKKHILEN